MKLLHSCTLYSVEKNYFRLHTSYSFAGLAVPQQNNARNDENVETTSERTDHLAFNESDQSTSNKGNAPEMESRSPSPDRDKFITSILHADSHLHVRPQHVRRLSQSFDNIMVLPNIKEE